MAKKTSRERIIFDLNERKINFNDEMTDDQLAELLKSADEKNKPPQPIDYSGVKCGLDTIQDHERRIVMIERNLAKMEK
jgi:hypothetical protein